MATLVKRSLNQPDETKNFEKLKVEIVAIEDIKFKRVTAQPGWQWSKHLKPVEGGESYQRHHLIYVISGKLHVRMVDGQDSDFGPGDTGSIPPGHDGWNAGAEPLVWLEVMR